MLQIERWVIISMMVTCNANAIIEYDRRRSGLSHTPLDMEYDNNSIEQLSSKHRLSILILARTAWQKDSIPARMARRRISPRLVQ